MDMGKVFIRNNISRDSLLVTAIIPSQRYTPTTIWVRITRSEAVLTRTTDEKYTQIMSKNENENENKRGTGKKRGRSASKESVNRTWNKSYRESDRGSMRSKKGVSWKNVIAMNAPGSGRRRLKRGKGR